MIRTLLLVLLLPVLFVVPRATAAADFPDPEDGPVRLFYYRDGPKALASLKKNYRSIDVLAPQTHTIDAGGTLAGEVPKAVLRFAKGKRLAVVPLVTNGAFSAGAASAFLLDEDARERAVSAMAKEGKKRGYAGWQIDFEQIDASLKDHFTAFVAEAERALEEEGMSLSVAVVSKISDNPDDYPAGLWQKLIGVYDYEALGKAADFVSVMSYDEPYKTGPVSPFPWLERVLDYTLERVPAEKVSLGVPTYYWEREDKPQGRIMEIGGAAGVAEAKGHRKAKTGYDEAMQTAFVRFTLAKGDPRVVWHENRRSVEAKLDLAGEHDLHGVSVWALGLELPETHRAFQGWN